jgi:hypothetical protein
MGLPKGRPHTEVRNQQELRPREKRLSQGSRLRANLHVACPLCQLSPALTLANCEDLCSPRVKPLKDCDLGRCCAGCISWADIGSVPMPGLASLIRLNGVNIAKSLTGPSPVRPAATDYESAGPVRSRGVTKQRRTKR